MKWHLDNIYKIPTNFNPPKIPYRETITKTAQADYRHRKQSGGAGQFGEVHMIIEPYEEGSKEASMQKINGKEIKISVRDKEEIELPWGGKLVYVNSIVGGAIDARFYACNPERDNGKNGNQDLLPDHMPAISGFMYMMARCTLLIQMKFHSVLQEEMHSARHLKLPGLKSLSRFMMLRSLFLPIVWVMLSATFRDARGMVLGMSSEKRFEVIKAKVPLAEMNKYSTALSSITGGRAMYTMKFAEYAQVPGDVQEQVIKAYSEEEEEE